MTCCFILLSLYCLLIIDAANTECVLSSLQPPLPSFRSLSDSQSPACATESCAGKEPP